MHRSIIDDYLREFLRGFFDGEGYVGGHKRGKYVYGYIGAKNTNFEVMRYIGRLLNRLSIHHKIYKVKSANEIVSRT